MASSCATFASPPATPVTELRVMISPGFAAAYDTLTPIFEREHGVRIVTARGASTGTAPDAIPVRLANGEAADIVILSIEGLEPLVRSGVVEGATRRDVGTTRIGVAVAAGRPRPDISSVDSFRRALLEARAVAYSSGPSGLHVSNTVLPRLGIKDQVAAKAVVVATPAVPGVITRGEVDFGFQQLSELVPVAGLDVVGTIPEELQLITPYAAAVVRTSGQPALARALVDFLASDSVTPFVLRMGLRR
jgi:molybdate transport system substrate-binding protein